METPHVITIDGPAGAGKSTLGELLARTLGYLYFDTGVMYRALTLAAITRGIACEDIAALTRLAETLDIGVTPPHVDDGRQYTVRIDGEDITWQLRQPEVEKNVSAFSRDTNVRTVMRRRQREIGETGRVVMVGRDIGSMVMTDAPLKIYLEASIDERAKRRTAELQAQGREAEVGSIRQDVERRDALDRHVMQPAPDALVLHSDELTPEDEVAVIMRHIAAQASGR